MLTPIHNDLFIMPLSFHPTTTIFVDDDNDFLNELSEHFYNKLPILTFDDPNTAISYFGQHIPSLIKERSQKKSEDNQSDFDILAIRNEIYNKDRFKEVVVCVVDFNMPNKNGFDLMASMKRPEGCEHQSYILLTGASMTELGQDSHRYISTNNLINKADPKYQEQLLDCIERITTRSLQWYFYDVARQMTLNKKEKANILFDGNFVPTLNAYIKKNKICEYYLFDSQGSFIFLDKDAHPSWFFVRNDLGIKRSIQNARAYKAPQRIIDALQSKKMILSLYEKEDFESRKTIDWDKYLLPSTVFSGDDKFMQFFNLDHFPQYYYAFSDNLPEYDFKRNDILSYAEFLKGAA